MSSAPIEGTEGRRWSSDRDQGYTNGSAGTRGESTDEGGLDSLGLHEDDIRDEQDRAGASRLTRILDHLDSMGPGRGPLKRPVQAIEAAADAIKNSMPGRWARRAISPGSFDVNAKNAAMAIRHMWGRLYAMEVQMGHQLNAASDMLDRMPVAEWNRIGIAWSQSHYEDIPTELQPFFRKADELTAEATARVQSIGGLKEAQEHYVGRIWRPRGQRAAVTDDEARKIYAKVASKRPLTGSKSFLKKRYYDEYEEAINAGLEPIYNPLKTQMIKMLEMNRFFGGSVLVKAAKNSGIAQFVKRGDPVPDGMMELQGPEFQREAHTIEKEGEKTVIRPGAWFAPEGWARVYNNFVSKGLSATIHAEPAQMLRDAANLMNMFQLGLSLFHPMFTSIDAQVSRIAIGIDQAVRGEFGNAAKNVLFGISPTNWVTNVKDGDRMIQSILDPHRASPEQQRLVQAFEAAGGRIWMERVLRPSDEGPIALTNFNKDNIPGPPAIRNTLIAVKAAAYLPVSLARAWKQAAQKYPDSIVRPIFNVIARTMETTSAPIMTCLVPRQKLGVFSRMASDWIASHPDASNVEFVAKMQDLWESVDNRLGQMVYDNLFWDKTFKDVSFMTVRSVGWNMGSIRELGGGSFESGQYLLNKAAGRDVEWPHRLSYIMALTAMTTVMGAIMTYLFTGSGPKQFKDYIFPPTGEKRVMKMPGGKTMSVDERISLPTYMKDVYAWSIQPGQTAKNKLHPLLSSMAQMWDNHDYYGDLIRNEDDPLVTQLWDVMKFTGVQFEPFTFRNTAKLYKEKPGVQASLGMLGFQPAPGYIVAPEANAAWEAAKHKAEVKKTEKHKAAMGEN